MAKAKTRFVCSECGHDEPKWVGRCPACGEWNCFKEIKNSIPVGSSGTERKSESRIPVNLNKIDVKQDERFSSGFEELNRVLGGGVLPGAAILLGGEPGIGKSTLLLQMAHRVSQQKKILYVSGEESAFQIKLRADRLKLKSDKIEILCDTHLGNLISQIDAVKPSLVIVDSIQTIFTESVTGIPGSLSQLKSCCFELITYCKDRSISLFFIGHVTKEGSIAGPKAIEHLVDTVLYFEQSDNNLRVIRPSKNRFGSVEEIALFYMEEKGLEEVEDSSLFFSSRKDGEWPSGVSIATMYEGSRVLLIEIQALTVSAQNSSSRVYSEKISTHQVSRVAAILEKHIGISFTDQDIYINVAGGIKVNDPAIELALAFALYSARTGLQAINGICGIGELSLAGEIRSVPHLNRRIKSVTDGGITKIMHSKITEKKPLSHDKGFCSLKDAVLTAFK